MDETTKLPPVYVKSVSAELLGNQPHHTLVVDMELESIGEHRPAWIDLEIKDAASISVAQPLPTIEGFLLPQNRQHRVKMTVELPPLIPGAYSVTVEVMSHNTDLIDQVRECVGFEIATSPTEGRTYPHTPDHGYVVPITHLEYAGQ